MSYSGEKKLSRPVRTQDFRIYFEGNIHLEVIWIKYKRIAKNRG